MGGAFTFLEVIELDPCSALTYTASLKALLVHASFGTPPYSLNPKAHIAP